MHIFKLIMKKSWKKIEYWIIYKIRVCSNLCISYRYIYSDWTFTVYLEMENTKLEQKCLFYYCMQAISKLLIFFRMVILNSLNLSFFYIYMYCHHHIIHLVLGDTNHDVIAKLNNFLIEKDQNISFYPGHSWRVLNYYFPI
jgi:hypothetical protein